MAPPTRLGLIGDIHAEHEALAAALTHLTAQGVDAILAVGDIVDGPGDVDACCTLLQKHKVTTVRGNHERWFLRDEMRRLPDATPRGVLSATTRAFLEALPATQVVTTARGQLLLCHGLGDDDMCTVRPTDFGYALETNDPLQALSRSDVRQLVVCGHSHQRMVRTFGTATIINAGTLAREESPCFGLLDLTMNHVTFFERLLDGQMIVADVLALS